MKEDLMFCSMGNGITIADRNQEKYSDYKTVAHIGYNRDITYYDKKMTREAVNCIERFAKYNNSYQYLLIRFGSFIVKKRAQKQLEI